LNLLPVPPTCPRRRWPLFTTALTVPLVAFGLLLATPAAAAPDGGQTTPAAAVPDGGQTAAAVPDGGQAAPDAAPVDGGETAPAPEAVVVGPTVEEVAAQRAAADRLAAEVADQGKALEQARQAINDLQTTAEQATRSQESALASQARAEAENIRQTLRLQAASRIVDARKGELGRWASQTYRNGGSMGDIEGMMTLLESDSSAELSQRAQMLDMVGRWRGSVVNTVEEAEAVQQDATRKADVAAETATIAAAQAATAKAEAGAALVKQSDEVALLGALLRATQEAAEAADQKTLALAEAFTAAELERAVSEQLRLAAAAAGQIDNRVTGAVGECQGLPVEGFPNGVIPAEALCPLWAASGQLLRADAAFGFNQMSEAYALQFGTPICVTDSYRSFEGQVSVYANKPDLAAIPGTSNHGWGSATDLCGGIQTFGTPQHEWMRANAPLYGFFHPAWAKQGGNREEPWHWEYGS